MIDRITINSFKSAAKVEIDLGTVNVFVGANGSGKTNILEAIGVLGAAAEGRVDDSALLRRGVRPGVPALYKSSWKGEKLPATIDLEARQGGVEYRVGLFNPVDDPEPSWRYKTERLAGPNLADPGSIGRSPASHERLHPERGLVALKAVEFEPDWAESRLLDSLRDYSVFNPNTLTFRGLIPETQPHEPIGLSGGRLAEAVDELLQQGGEEIEDLIALIGWVESVSAGRANSVSPSVSVPRIALKFVDRYMAKGRNTLTAYDASEGALYVLFAGVLALHRRAPAMLAVDNIDQALNPILAREMIRSVSQWTLAANTARQLLLTAHNPLLLDGLPLLDDRVRLFTVARSDRGRTVVRRIEITEQVLNRVSDGWTVSRMWTAGHLGGVPSV